MFIVAATLEPPDVDRSAMVAVPWGVMTDRPSEADVTTADEFEAAIGSLLAAAERHDIDPSGSWVYRDGESAGHEWEVVICELANTKDTED
jgi:hypothetical protein